MVIPRTVGPETTEITVCFDGKNTLREIFLHFSSMRTSEKTSYNL